VRGGQVFNFIVVLESLFNVVGGIDPEGDRMVASDPLAVGRKGMVPRPLMGEGGGRAGRQRTMVDRTDDDTVHQPLAGERGRGERSLVGDVGGEGDEFPGGGPTFVAFRAGLQGRPAAGTVRVFDPVAVVHLGPVDVRDIQIDAGRRCGERLLGGREQE